MHKTPRGTSLVREGLSILTRRAREDAELGDADQLSGGVQRDAGCGNRIVDEGSRQPRRYRNWFLMQAMVELNIIDTIGYGIHKMHTRRSDETRAATRWTRVGRRR